MPREERRIVSSRLGAKRATNRSKSLADTRAMLVLVTVRRNKSARDAAAICHISVNKVEFLLFVTPSFDESIENRFSRLHDHACIHHSSEESGENGERGNGRTKAFHREILLERNYRRGPSRCVFPLMKFHGAQSARGTPISLV